MNKKQALKIAIMMIENRYYGIEIVETYPEKSIIVTGYNSCGNQRWFHSLEDARRNIHG